MSQTLGSSTMPTKSAVLIYNPKAGKHKATLKAEALVATLRAAGFSAKPVPTTCPGDATLLAQKHASSVEVVFALGGDGTLREAAKGLLGTGVPLGVLPGGTTNVLVRALGLPLDPFAVARRAGGFKARSFDVGRCNGEPFLMMASCGLDAQALRSQSSRFKAILGRASVGLQGLASWWSYDYSRLDVYSSGQHIGDASFVAACNIPLYGGSFRLAPEARVNDGLLDLILFRGKGRVATLAFARDLALGRHLRRSDVVTLRASDACIKAARPAPLQIDGDLAGESVEWKLSADSEELSILAPTGSEFFG